MVAIVSGNSLGLNLGSLASLGVNGRIGTPTQGGNGEGAFVNVASGNLVLQDVDGLLMGVGANVTSARTYNSQGTFNFSNGDGWSNSQNRAVVALGNGELQRTDGDGSTSTYAWDAASQTYIGTVGAGSVVSTIIANTDGSYTWTNGATGAKETYAGSGMGLIQSTTDTSGNTTTFAYGASDLLSAVTTSDGETVHYTYDGANLTNISTTLQSGQVTSDVTYEYDALNRLSSVSVTLDPTGTLAPGSEGLATYQTQYEYDGTSDRIASISQSDGTTQSFTYVLVNGSYHVATWQDGQYNTTSFTYDTAGQTTTVTDALGVSNVYQYDVKGQLTQIRNGVTSASTISPSQMNFAYNAIGDVTSMTDGVGNTTQMVYDSRGNLTSRVDAAGDTHTWSYNAANQVVASTIYATAASGFGATATAASDADTTRYVYSAADANQLRFTITPQGNVTEYRYTSAGLLSSSISYTAGSFDTSALTTTSAPSESDVQAWIGNQDLTHTERSDMAYDFRGQLQSTTTYGAIDATGAGTSSSATSTQYVFDRRGQLLQSIQPNATSVVQYTYDGLGRLVSKTGPSLDGTTPNVSLTSYDDANGKVTLTLANGLSTTSTYDASGRLVSVTQAGPDGSLGTASYAYDQDGRLLMTQDATGVRHWTLYDAQGRKSGDIDGAGMFTEYIYNADNQVVQSIAYNTPVDVSQLVDSAGNPLTSAIGATDSLRPSTSTTDRKNWYFYDEAQRLSYAVDGLGNVTQTDYDGESRVTGTTQLARPINVALLQTTGPIAPPSHADGNSVTVEVPLAETGAVNELFLDAFTDYDGEPVTSGTFSVFDGQNFLGSIVASASGTTTFDFDALADGYHTLTIIYAGGSDHEDATTTVGVSFASSAGTPAAAPSTITSLNTSASDIAQNSVFDLTADVAGAGSSGYVTFYSGVTLLGTAFVVSGEATLTTTMTLPQGTQTIQASYSDSDTVVSHDLSPALTVNVRSALSAEYIASLTTADSANDRTVTDIYDRDGNLQATIDAEGYLTQFKYDGSGQLVETVEYANAVPGFTSAASIASNVAAARSNHDLSALLPTPSADDIHTYQYFNARGEVSGKVDGDGYLSEFIYDANGNLTTSIRYATPTSGALATSSLLDIRPASTSLDRVDSQVWNTANELISHTTADGTVSTFTYDPIGRLVSTTVAAGGADQRTLTQRYDLQGRVTAQLSANGAALLTGSQTQAQVDAIWAEYASTYTYDAAGRRTSATDAVGDRTVFFYDDAGRLRYSVDALGDVTENTYDALGHLTSNSRFASALPGSNLVALQGGLLSASQNADATAALASAESASASNSTTAYAYDAIGERVQSIAPEGETTSFTYDAFGEVTQTTRSSVTDIATYDRRGLRVISEADATGYMGIQGIDATTATQYDAFGRVTSATDPNGNVTTASYDALGRVISTTDGTNATRSTTYDAFGQILTQTDALGATTSYSYDAQLRSTTLTTPEGVSVTTVRTAEGQTRSMTDGDGNTTSYVYDADGNLLSTVTPVTTTSDTYDAADRIISSTDANGNVATLQYDAANHVLSRTLDPAGLNLTTSYQYDAKGEQVRITDPDGRITAISYDLSGQILTQIVDPDGLAETTTYTYDSNGNVLTVQNPGGTTTRYAYDDLGRRVSSVVDANDDGSGLRLTTSYTYDAAGNVVKSTNPLGYPSYFAYDADNRLIYSIGPDSHIESIEYDANGRVLTTTKYADIVLGIVFQPSLTASEIASYISLNPTFDRVQHNVYDADGRMTYVVDGTGAVTQYDYDGAGNVVTRTRYANPIDLSSWTPGSNPDVYPSSYGSPYQDQTVQTVYDQLNRPVYTIDGIGAITATTYDGNGNVVDKVAYANPGYPAWTPADMAFQTASLADPSRDAHTQAIYDSANRLAWSMNGVGSVTHNEYDADGNLVKQTEFAQQVYGIGTPDSVAPSSADRVTVFAYDKAGRRVYTVDALGDVTHFVLDANGNTIEQTAYANRVPAFSANDAPVDAATLDSLVSPSANDRRSYAAFDAADRQVYAVDAEGGVVRNLFDEAGNVIATTAFATRIGSLESLAESGALSVDAINALVTIDPVNDRTSFSVYDGAGKKDYSVDALGYLTEFAYDGVGNLRGSDIPVSGAAIDMQGVDLFADDAKQQIIAAVLAFHGPVLQVQGSVFLYDAAGNLTSSMDALGNFESYTYDALGQKISFTNKLGVTWNYVYDAAGHMTTEYAPDPSNSEYQGYYGGIYADAQTVMTYDALGNITSRTEGANSPYARVTRYEYDALGRQVRTTYPAVYVYDGATDAANGYYGGAYGYRDENWVTPSSEIYYDTFGDAVVSADVGGNVSVKTYDALGRVSYDMDALGYVTGYVRNTFGDVTGLTHYANASGLIAGVTAAAQTADAAVVANNVPKTADVSASLVTSTQDRTIQTRYDALGRPIMVIQPQAWVDNGDGQPGKFASAFIQNTYNAFGQVVQVLNGGIDQLGQEIQQSASPDITRYVYDRSGYQIAKIDALGYLTAQTFDAEGNVLSVTQYATALIPNNASPTGFSPAVTSSDDRTVVYAYDLNNRKISQTQVNVLYSTQSDGVALPGDLTTTFGYDALGNNTRTTDALGNSTYTYYDANGRIRAVAGPATYDGGDQTLIALTEFTRDVFGNVTQKTEYAYGVYWANEVGYQIRYAPDGGYGGGYGGSYGGGYGGGYGGSYPANRVTSTTYDAYGHAIQVQDANGNNHYMSYDVEGRIAKSWQTISNYSAYFPNGGPEVLYTVYQYDALGRQTGIITPASNIVFRGEGLVKRNQDVVGYVINGMSWNAFGEMVASGTWSSDSAPQYQQSYEYDNAGRLWRTNSGDGNVKVVLYNLQGQQSSQITSAGSVNLNSFSSAQAVDAQGNSGLRRTDMQRDLLGHIHTETLPQRQDSTDASPYRPIVYMDYDRWGNVVSQSDPRNANWLTTYTYNANNQVIQKYQSGDPGTDGSSATTRIFYDALGRQVAVLDANNHLNGQVWNAAGQLIQEQHADTGVVSHTYDALGEQIRQVDADGNVTDYRYDGLGNNTVTKYENVGVYHSNAAFAVTGEVTDIQIYKYYDAAGRLLQQSDNAGDVFTMYSYDLRGNVVSTTDKNNHSTLAAYDAQGKQTFSQDANGNVASWSYDTFGQLTGHTDIGGASYAFTYDTARQLISQTNSRGQDLEYQYDAAGQLTDIQSTISGSGGSAVIQNTHYAYNAAGQHVLEQTTQGGVVSQNQTLGYDFFGRLALVNAADGVSTLTDYDRVGNKVSVHATYNTPSVFGPIGHVEDLYFAYDSMNRQIMADGAVDNNAGNLANINASQGHILTYDKNGNRLSDTAWGNRVVMRYDTIDESGTALGLPTLKDSAVDRGVQTQFYTYDTMNRLSTVSTQQWIQMQTGWTESGGEAGGATTTSEVYGDVTQLGPNITLDSRKYDGAGRLILSGPQLTLTPQYAQALSGGDGNAEGATSTINTYDAAGRMTSSFSVSTFDPSRNTITYYQAFAPTLAPTLFDAPVGSGYDAAGNLLSYRTVTAKDGDFIITSTVVQQSTQLGEGYKETGRISLAMNLSSGNITNGQTIETYDNNGFLTGVADFEPANPSALYNNRTFVNDAQGHVLTATETALGVQTHQLVLNGQVSATYGFTQDPVNPTFPNGVPNYQVTGNFDMGYQPVTNSYPAASTGTYSVRAGDTLKDIALASYGDASMWYVIANANGMQGDSDLRVGQVLNIPTKVAGVHNSSNTYAPYDPSKIVGSTSPALPTPAGRAPDSGCGGLGQIVMVVVAVIATIYTAGLAAEGLEGAAAATGSAGTAAAGTTATGAVATAATAAAAGTSTFTIGLSTLAGGYGVTAAVVGGAVGGLVGSIASQTVGIAIGAQQDFNWNAVAVGAIGGAISGGLGYVGGGTGLLGGPTVGATAARAAISSAATQGISVALGLQQHFSWSQVAASAIGAGVSAGLNDAMGYKPINGFNFGKSLISGIAGQTVAAVAVGGKVNVTQIATGAFGSITSDFLAGTYGQQTGAAAGQGEQVLQKTVGNALGSSLADVNGQSSNIQDDQAVADTQSGRAQNLAQLRAWAGGYSGGGAGTGNQGAVGVTAPPSLMNRETGNASTASMFDTPQIVLSGPSYALYDNTAETRGVAPQGVGDVIRNVDVPGTGTITPYQGIGSNLINTFNSGLSLSDKLSMASGQIKYAYRGSDAAQGAVQIIGGGLEVWGATTLSATGVGAVVGVPMAFHGGDSIGTGFNRMFGVGDGTTLTYKGTYQGVYALTGSTAGAATAASFVDQGIPFAGGVASLASGMKSAWTVTAADSAAGLRWEASQAENAVNNATQAARPAQLGGAAWKNGIFQQAIEPRSNLEIYGQAITRTPEQATSILQSVGYDAETLSGYKFVPLTESRYAQMVAEGGGKEFSAKYGIVPPGQSTVKFDTDIASSLVSSFGEKVVPVFVHPSVFQSDEAIVQIFSHEIHEIEAFRYGPPVMSSLQYESATTALSAGNLHAEAVSVGDSALLRFRQILGH